MLGSGGADILVLAADASGMCAHSRTDSGCAPRGRAGEW
jgi:hypothetical protein